MNLNLKSKYFSNFDHCMICSKQIYGFLYTFQVNILLAWKRARILSLVKVCYLLKCTTKPFTKHTFHIQVLWTALLERRFGVGIFKFQFEEKGLEHTQRSAQNPQRCPLFSARVWYITSSTCA